MQIAHVRASCPIYDEVRVVGCHVSVCARTKAIRTAANSRYRLITMGEKDSPLRNEVVFSRDEETEKISKASRLQRLSPFKISGFSTFRI